MSKDPKDTPGPLGLSRYQWRVLIAAWLGWGLNIFCALLFNYVAALCLPDLLGLSESDPAFKGTIAQWTGYLTAELLLGWAIGGIVFGKLTDRIGRTRTLVFTMITFSLATGACALAPNIWTLAILRAVASLGIGGEWAAGASLVAETVPEEKRVLSGSLLYTSSPLGLLLATWVTDLVLSKIGATAGDPTLAWRVVFATGLIPILAAIWVARTVKEPGEWKPAGQSGLVRELFTPELRRTTIGGLAMAGLSLVTWWTYSAFIPTIARFLADDVVPLPPPGELAQLKVAFATRASALFNFSGFVGTLLTIPAAIYLGRRLMFVSYFAVSSALLWCAFALPLEPHTRISVLGLSGLTVFGIFGAFPFYLPELYPMRLRGTGAGFTYNTGRVLTAVGPFVVGEIARTGVDPVTVLQWVAIVPVVSIGFVLGGFVRETRGQDLAALETLGENISVQK